MLQRPSFAVSAVVAYGVLACGLAACGGDPTSTTPLPDMAQPPLPDGLPTYAGSVTIKSTPFVLMPGEEVFKCQDFANPFGAVDTDIQAFDSTMTPGSHHLLFFYQDDAVDKPLADCAPLQFQPLAYGAQTPRASIVYPAGIAAQLRSTQGFHVQMHYLNTTMSPLTVELEVVVFKSAAGTTTQHAGVFFLNNLSGMNVPAHSVKTVTASYTFKIPVKLLYATGHLHKYDNNLIATLGGQPLFDTTSWDATPFKKFTPEVDVPVGTTVTWSCEVNNTTDGTLTFGESALTNNMCIFNGQYYPVPAGADPTILGIH